MRGKYAQHLMNRDDPKYDREKWIVEDEKWELFFTKRDAAIKSMNNKGHPLE